MQWCIQHAKHRTTGLAKHGLLPFEWLLGGGDSFQIYQPHSEGLGITWYYHNMPVGRLWQRHTYNYDYKCNYNDKYTYHRYNYNYTCNPDDYNWYQCGNYNCKCNIVIVIAALSVIVWIAIIIVLAAAVVTVIALKPNNPTLTGREQLCVAMICWLGGCGSVPNGPACKLSTEIGFPSPDSWMKWRCHLNDLRWHGHATSLLCEMGIPNTSSKVT